MATSPAPSSTLSKFNADLLAALGAPATQANLAWLGGWENREGTAAANNPLATTLREPGSYGLQGNSAGVQQYPTETLGVQATLSTLEHGYPGIVSGIKSGNPRFTADVGNELLKWSGGGYSSFTPGAGYPVAGTGLGGVDTTVNATATAAQAVVDTATSIPKALAFVFSYRFLEILGGGVLILAGLYVLAKQFGATFPSPAPVKAAANAISSEDQAAVREQTRRESAAETYQRRERSQETHAVKVKQAQARTTEIRGRSRARSTKARLTKEAARREYNRGALDAATAEASPTMTEIRRQRSSR